MTTHFFKIILSTEPRLRLPNKFVSKYKESMPSLVSVDGPHGPAFQVELTPSDGQIWLAKGGMKVDYPSTSSKGKHPEKVSNKPCCLREETKLFSGDISEKNITVDDIARKRDISEREKLEEDVDDVSIDIMEEDNEYQVSGHFMNGISGKRETENLEKVKTYQKRKQSVSFMNPAHEAAKAFISTRPSVVLFMHRTSIMGQLDINKRFSLELNKKKDLCDVVLRVPGAKRTWTAKCRIRKSSARLYWKTFVKDNGLCEGDSCVFELLNGTTPTLNVIIFRSTEDADVNGNFRNKDRGEVSRKQKICEGKKLEKVDNDDEGATEIDDPVTSFKGKHPHKVSNKPCCMRMEREVVSGKCIKCLYEMLDDISRKRKIAERKKSEELDDDVSLEILEKNMTSDDISRKREVSKKDKLEEAGDDGSLEILEEEIFVNGISRKRKLENMEKITTWPKRNQALESKKLTALDRAHAFMSSRPAFVSYAHGSYIDGGLSISKQFVQQFIKVDNACNVVLRVPGDTRTWAVKCRIGSSNAILRWKRFVKDNGLCEGDACVFELGDDSTPSLNVTIFRSSEAQGIKVT